MRTAPNQRIALLFLAAGASRRMGRDKALLPWKGRSVLAHHVATLSTVPRIDPWIVTRPHDAPLENELDALAWPPAQRVINPRAPDCDMFTSIQCGMRGMLQETHAWLGIALIDQVLTAPGTFQRLADEAAEQPGIIQPAYEGRRGHPVLLSRAIAEHLATHEGPTLKHFLDAYEAQRIRIDVEDRGVVTDMDTPAAYETQLASS